MPIGDVAQRRQAVRANAGELGRLGEGRSVERHRRDEREERRKKTARAANTERASAMLPVADHSAKRSDVIRYPERTKKRSTPR